MNKLFRIFVLSAMIVSARPGQLLADEKVRVPADLEVPAGNTAFLKLQARGTQNYICLPTATGQSWTFLGPQATLFVAIPFMDDELRHQVTTHFLSPNPDEGGTARATWQSSLDTSAVWARAVANSSDRAYVAEGAIPWLLLEAVGTRPGENGGSMLTPTTFIQRIETAGGVAPSTGCTGAANIGSTVFVPYTTTYVFYRAR